ncbi:hypothetical protein [Dietzia sp. 179-F 9C3 NHS]|uniref:hypothetical protein n=1 Tax=Dietzia sp. 179-F 9C3 NHS TaxID=3374295 RepID=UPI0038797583
MCRAQPGPRCPKHTRAKITSLLATRKRIEDRLAAANPGTRAWEKAAQDRQRNDEALVLANNELNSSTNRQKELEDTIETLASTDPKDPKLRTLARDLATGRLLHAERLRQQKLMPAIDLKSCHPAARQAWLELGEARASMARYKVRMDVNGSQPDVWASWRDRHADAARRAELAAARFEAIQKNGPQAWGLMTADERTKARAAVNETADFTTPTAPQTLEDVFNDYIDQQGGASPNLDPRLVNWAGEDNPAPDVDSPAWAEARARRNAAEAAGDTDADGPVTAKPFSGKQQTPPGYAGRRATRRQRAGSARQLLREIRRGTQSMDSEKLQSLLRPAPGQDGDPSKAAIADPTGMMMLLALFTGRR